MGIEMTAAEVAAAKEHNRVARRRCDEALARKRRHSGKALALKDQRADLMRQVRELDAEIREERTDAWEAQRDALEAATGKMFVPFDAEPEDVADVGEWSRRLRRRAWATAFADGPVARPFSGATGTRDLMLFLTLCALAERQGAQVVEADIPDMVRVAAMDNKTVVAGLRALRDSGLLLWVDVHRHAPVGSPLVSVAEAPELPQAGLAERFFWGDREHDAFGGRHGIKPVWVRTWVWLCLNPGASRAEVGKRAGPKGQTAYRVIEEMEKFGLVRVGHDGRCFVIEPQAADNPWLDGYAERRGLYGAVEKRVERARLPAYLYVQQKGATRSAMSQMSQASGGEAPVVRRLNDALLAELDFSDLEVPEHWK